jgi:hypothetical protein
MNRISRTVIAGCALSAVAMAICSASARAGSLEASDVVASAKDGGVAIELAAKDAGKSELAAKDGGVAVELAAKDAGKSELAAKDAGKSELAAKDAGKFEPAFAKDGGVAVLSTF